ncbi:long-chain-fatty-acid--CoA ligase [Methylocystis parvus]|uniref:Long-chain-fatty-acid--CoA ligase n=1 Tax=Methylocystis parvus TaxID=134 RepID=A0A6B8LVX2_9HYPH|nr:long-chain-fatty-acid--CoA ligase [Methylocystis parvus]QGM96557.1 long-chain-fatty-acid--CoA ligase [Methylocystis parvus]WBJ99591.1 long-chain-fatty-acid--CoA ligase [Methylocystis parvus OBBP]
MTRPEQSLDPYAARPWLASYPNGAPANIDVSAARTLVDDFRQSVAAFPDRPVMESFGARLTYRELERAADSIAAWLQSQGLQKGDRVAIMSPNVLGYPAAMFGALIAGGVVVNVNPLYTHGELEHQINDAGARFVFVFENFADTVETAWPNMKVERAVVMTPGDLMGLKGYVVNFVSRHVKKMVPAYRLPASIAFSEVLKEGARTPLTPIEIAPDDMAFLQYTGGTTGVAKGAVLLHRNVSIDVAQTWAWLEWYLGPACPHVMITALPLYHIFALTACCMLTIRTGGCCVLIANPRDLKGFIATIRKRRFTIFAGVNTLYAALADHPEIRSVDFSNLSMNISGGMSTQEGVARKWAAITGKPIIEGYGLSETSPIVTVNRPDIGDFTGAIGYPIPSTEVSIRDADGGVVPAGERGELCVRGPQVMPGYWRRPDETAKVTTPDGFFKTGDIAIMEPDGLFRIVDRLKDMILVSGFNVYPNEVEAALAEHPNVKEVAVIGVPYRHSGEAPMAFIVRRDPSLTAEELRAFAHERLTGYKVPRFFEFRDSLPKTNVGKILRRALRDEYFARCGENDDERDKSLDLHAPN